MMLSHMEFYTDDFGHVIVYFSDWRRANGYRSRTHMRDNLLSDGYSEEDFEREWEEIEDEFYSDCAEYGYEAEMDE